MCFHLLVLQLPRLRCIICSILIRKMLVVIVTAMGVGVGMATTKAEKPPVRVAVAHDAISTTDYVGDDQRGVT